MIRNKNRDYNGFVSDINLRSYNIRNGIKINNIIGNIYKPYIKSNNYSGSVDKINIQDLFYNFSTSSGFNGIYYIASSNDFKYIIIGKNNGSIYYSSDYGITFGTSTGTSNGITGLVASSDGRYVYATYIRYGYQGYLLRSTDYGATFSIVNIGNSSGNFYNDYMGGHIDCSSDGSIVYVVSSSIGSGVGLYKSTDYGATFNSIDTEASLSVCCDDTGNIVYTWHYSDYKIYKSINGGTSFTSSCSGSKPFTLISCDKTGSYVAAINYKSSDQSGSIIGNVTYPISTNEVNSQCRRCFSIIKTSYTRKNLDPSYICTFMGYSTQNGFGFNKFALIQNTNIYIQQYILADNDRCFSTYRPKNSDKILLLENISNANNNYYILKASIISET